MFDNYFLSSLIELNLSSKLFLYLNSIQPPKEVRCEKRDEDEEELVQRRFEEKQRTFQDIHRTLIILFFFH